MGSTTLTMAGVTEENFLDKKPSIEAGLSVATGIATENIATFCVETVSTRRMLKQGHVLAVFMTPASEASSLATTINSDTFVTDSSSAISTLDDTLRVTARTMAVTEEMLPTDSVDTTSVDVSTDSPTVSTDTTSVVSTETTAEVSAESTSVSETTENLETTGMVYSSENPTSTPTMAPSQSDSSIATASSGSSSNSGMGPMAIILIVLGAAFIVVGLGVWYFLSSRDVKTVQDIGEIKIVSSSDYSLNARTPHNLAGSAGSVATKEGAGEYTFNNNGTQNFPELKRFPSLKE